MKKIKKFIPVNIPKLNKQEIKNINICLRTNWISSEGKFVKEFEKKFSSFNKRKYGIAVSSGTAALEVAIKALNLKKGTEVIIPSFSIISTALCVVKCGLKPILIDCNIETWNVDAEKVINKISNKTSAIIITHIYGLPVNLKISEQNLLNELEFSKKILEDKFNNVINIFCYPYGKVNQNVYALTKKIYNKAVTTNRSRYDLYKHNSYLIPRIDMGKNFSSLKLYLKLETIYEDIKYKKNELHL